MDNNVANYLISTKFFEGTRSFLRRCLFQVLAFGPMPRHIAFIPDGNRRYSRKWKLKEGETHRTGYFNLISIIKYCYEMGVQYVSVYGFSIDNFKRRPAEIQMLMKVIQENLEAIIQYTSIVNQLGVRVEILGNLDLLDESVREAAKRAKAATARNNKLVLLVCLAYTSTDEIVHGAQGSCEEKWARVRDGKSEVRDGSISTVDMERHMYFAGHPDPDILIRSSGETRLSNFILWQTTYCLLYAPRCLWPEISLRHLVWAVLEYQRYYSYLEKTKKKLRAVEV